MKVVVEFIEIPENYDYSTVSSIYTMTFLFVLNIKYYQYISKLLLNIL